MPRKPAQQPKDETATRFSVSLPPDLARDFDAMIAATGQPNRSHAVADLIRDRLVEHHQKFSDAPMAGTITLVYDHHTPHLQDRLTEAQHLHHDAIISAMHVHLDHDNCLEVIVLRGPAPHIRSIADALLNIKGVKHGKLTLTTPGKLALPHTHPHPHPHPHPHATLPPLALPQDFPTTAQPPPRRKR